MSDPIDHITKSRIEDEGITVHSMFAGHYTDVLTVNVDPSDEEETVAILREEGYMDTSREILRDDVDASRFSRVKSVKQIDHDERDGSTRIDEIDHGHHGG